MSILTLAGYMFAAAGLACALIALGAFLEHKTKYKTFFQGFIRFFISVAAATAAIGTLILVVGTIVLTLGPPG